MGCASGAASGSGCGRGAASAVAGKFASNTFGDAPGQGSLGGFVASVVAGGTVSVIGGGKFANGALTAAFGYLFNQASRGCVFFCLTTVEASNRTSTLDEAVKAGAPFREITAPVLMVAPAVIVGAEYLVILPPIALFTYDLGASAVASQATNFCSFAFAVCAGLGGMSAEGISGLQKPIGRVVETIVKRREEISKGERLLEGLRKLGNR